MAALLLAGLALSAVGGSAPDPTDGPTLAERAAARAPLPVHRPREWAFWDQMASAFAAEPLPDGPSLPSAGFRAWFGTTYVDDGFGLDPYPLDCAGMALWLGEFERFGFEDGVRFVKGRAEPCQPA